MYVEGMTLAEAREWLKVVRAAACSDCEQCRWDIEDLEDRIADLA
jgi:hypothetical protein